MHGRTSTPVTQVRPRRSTSPVSCSRARCLDAPARPPPTLRLGIGGSGSYAWGTGSTRAESTTSPPDAACDGYSGRDRLLLRDEIEQVERLNRNVDSGEVDAVNDALKHVSDRLELVLIDARLDC